MVFDYSTLRGRIVEKFGTAEAFATVLGVTKQSVSAKLNNKSGFSQHDVVEWALLLDIDPRNYKAYFFTEKVKSV